MSLCIVTYEELLAELSKIQFNIYYCIAPDNSIKDTSQVLHLRAHQQV